MILIHLLFSKYKYKVCFPNQLYHFLIHLMLIQEKLYLIN